MKVTSRLGHPHLLSLFTSMLAACSLNPEYKRPEAPIPSSFNGADVAAPDEGQLDDWRRHFSDPSLQNLIEKSLAHNRDLKIAALRIEEARALYGIQRSERLPSVNANASFTRGKFLDPISGRSETSSQYSVGLGLMAFELDFFGRVRSLSEAALSRYLATAEAHRAAQISLISEVANAYVRDLALAQQEQLATDTLKSREDSRTLIQKRLDAGISGSIELRTAEMLGETSRARLAEVQRERAQVRNVLRILVGSFDSAVDDKRVDIEGLQFPVLPPGAPSHLLERRPDVRQAEQLLIAANADIGAARAAFFPRLSLTSEIGSVSDEFSGLFEDGSDVWSFMPQLTLPIFAGGRNKANLDLAHVRKNIAIVEYERVVQFAFRDVKDALTSRDQLLVQVDAQKAVRNADKERAKLSRLRFDKGIANYLEFLDSQRSEFESEQEYLRLHELRLANDIALYKALGGGWPKIH